MTKQLTLALVTAGVLALAGCSGAASAAGSAAEPAVTDSARNTITARGTGTAKGTPDVIIVTLGVETKSEAAATALDENNRLTTDVLRVLKTNGVADEDLQTSQLSIYPSYNNQNQITGYQVTNMLTAKLRDLTTAGAIIDTVSKTAGNAARIHQLSFSLDNDTELRAAARADAVQQAQAQAKQLADAAGVALGAIHAIVESPTSAPMPMYYANREAADSAAGSVPLEAGSQEIVVYVDVVYEISQ